MDALVEVVKHGSALHVDTAVQKLAYQINKPNSSEVFPLHVAVWRNHLPIIDRLLTAGACTTCTDGESGWTPLHRALYLGHLAAAARLLQAGASVEAADVQGRTPVDLVSAELQRMPADGTGRCSSIYSWGSGANYQLGTGSTDFHLNPLRVEALQGLGVVAVVGAKFHSAALTADGRLLTWGWGRGGRLGHPDYNIHSGETALIQPWQVAGLGRRSVVSVAAGKHHMVVATSTGELWTWGGNRDGKLGYANVDTQPTPRKVDFRGRAVVVAASNRHSACLTPAGEVWTWGSNNEGQLGYGTNNSANNPTPRMVEAMKGKSLVALSLAKRHTVVLTADGDAFTWGHRVVTPRRVPLAGSRDTARLAAVVLKQHQQANLAAVGAVAAPAAGGGGAAAAAALAGSSGSTSSLEVRFHRHHGEVARPEAALVAAGFTHTTVVTRTGEVLCWRSADPALRPQEVAGPLAGKRVVAVAAAKTRTVVVTDMGLVYMWECKERLAAGGPSKGMEGPGMTSMLGGVPAVGQAPGGAATAVGSGAAAGGPGGAGGAGAAAAAAAAAADDVPLIVPSRVFCLTRVAQVAVGEKHTLALQAWTLPPMPDEHGVMPQPRGRRRRRDSDSSDGSEEEDDTRRGSAGGAGGGRWRVPGAFPSALGAASTGAALRPGSLSRGNSSLGTSIGGGGLSMTSPLGSSPLARSCGMGADSALAQGVLPGGGTGGGAAGGGSFIGLLARRDRREGRRAADWGGEERDGPGWELFSHRTTADPDGEASGLASPSGRRRSGAGGDDGDDELFGFGDAERVSRGRGGRGRSSDGGGSGDGGGGAVPSLQVLCQRVVATQLVEPRTALPILEYADVAGAALLRCYCLAVATANLDCTLLEAPGGLTGLPPHLLAELEHLYRAALLTPPPPPTVPPPPPPGDSQPPASPALGSSLRSTSGSETPGGGVLGSSPPGGVQPYCGPELSSAGPESQLSALEAFHRRRVFISRLQLGRRPTAAPAWLAGAAAADRMAPHASSRMAAAALAALGAIGHTALPAHQPMAAGVAVAGNGPDGQRAPAAGAGPGEEAEGEVQRLVRNLQRKLQQIGSLEELARGGRQLDAQQHAKISQRGALQEALQALLAGASVEAVKQAIAHSAEVASKLAARPDAALTLSTGGSAGSGGAASGSAGGGGGGGGSQAGVSGTRGGAATSSGPKAAAAASAVQPSQQQQKHQRQQDRTPGGGGVGAVTVSRKAREPQDAAAAEAAAVTDSGSLAALPAAAASTATTPVAAAGGARLAAPTSLLAAATAASIPPAGAAKSPFAAPPPAVGPGPGGVGGSGPADGASGAPALPGGGGGGAISSSKKQQRRGGLSLFLSGALDQPVSLPPPVQPPQPATPAAPRAPAWGGAKLPTPESATSLRELLAQPPLSPAAQQAPPLAAAAPPPPAPSSRSASGPAAPAPPALSPSGPLPLPAQQAGTQAAAGGFPIAAAVGASASISTAVGRVKAGVAPAPASASLSSGGAGASSIKVTAPSGPGAAASLLFGSPGPSMGSIASAAGGSSTGGGGGAVKLTLAEFMSGRPTTAPLQVAGQRGREQERERDKEPAGPAWGAVQGGSPVGTKSLLDIQAEQAQVQRRAAASWGKPAASGAAAGAPGSFSGSGAPGAVPGAGPLGSSPPAPRPLLLQGPAAPPQQQASKWYVPEQCQPAVASKPLTAIQIEERAIKEITARYSGQVVARVVKEGGPAGAAAAGGAAGRGAAALAEPGSVSAGPRAGAGPSGQPAGSGTGAGGGKYRSRHKAGKGQGC